MSRHSHFHAETDYHHEIDPHAATLSLSQIVAILSALLSCLAVVTSYESARNENKAIISKSQAIMDATQMADAWSFYQSRQIKIKLLEMELANALKETEKQAAQDKLRTYRQESKDLLAYAHSLEHVMAKSNADASKYMKPHEKHLQSLTFLQLAISLASITVLTKQRWLLAISFISATMGVTLCVMGYLG